MAQEIYHRSNWGNPNEQWGNVYLNADLTNELYKRASEYENSWVTDQLLNGVGIKPSIILTPTAYEDGVLNSVKPSNSDGDFDFTRGSSATRVNEQGLVEDVTETDLPRINYTDGEGSLLLEPQSTNLVTYSEDFSEWSLGANATLTFVSDIEAPDGSLGVYRLQLPATNDTFISSNSFTGQNPLALSIYAKSVNTNNDFNLYNGSASSPIKTATDKWQRFDYIGNGNQFYIVNSGDTFITDIYIWGAQAEALSYATSYIPTEGSIKTRLADVCNNSGNSDLINSTEGVLYAEIMKVQETPDHYRLISLNNDASNSDANSVTLGFNNNTDDFYVIIKANNTNILHNYQISSNKNQFYKIAVKYKSGDCALWIDGVEQDTSTATFTFAQTLDNLSFDYNGNGILPFYGNVKCVAVFKEALSDTELEKLTTI